MITLYHAPSTAAFVVHWLLIELDLPHQLRTLDFDRREQKSPEYLKLNPAGVVPTLVIDGQTISEAAAIAMHLGDLHPQRSWAPAIGTAERAHYYQWMFFLANTLQPAYRAWFYPTKPAGAANVEASQTQARERIEWAWSHIATHLEAGGPYLLGSANIDCRLLDDDVDALVAQHAQAGRRLANHARLRATHEGAAGLQRDVRPRRPDRLGLTAVF